MNVVHFTLIALLAHAPTTAPSTAPATAPSSVMDQLVFPHAFENATLADAMDRLTRETHVNFIVNWKALEGAGIDRLTVVNGNCDGKSLADALTGILRNASPDVKLTYRFDDNVLDVSTLEWFDMNCAPAQAATRGEAHAAFQVAERLNTIAADLNFSKAPLNEVVKVLEANGVKIDVDYRELAEYEFGGSAHVQLSLKQVHVKTALNHIISELREYSRTELQWCIDGDHITISTAKKLSGE